MYYLDSSIWIAFFSAHLNQQFVAKMKLHTIYYSDMVLLEIADVLSKRGVDAIEAISFIEKVGRKIELTPQLMCEAAILKQTHRKHTPKFGILDSTHYILSQAKDCIFVSTDYDYKGLDNVEILKI